MTIRATRCFATALLTAFSIGLLASAGWAEADMRYHDLTTNVSTLELGSFFNSNDEFKFADFTGLGQGLDVGSWSILGNVDLRRRSAFDAERAYYYRIRGLNLGLDSRYVDAEYKLPGLFGISLFYDEIPKYQTDSAQTFMRNAGSSFLTLPPSWTSTSISDFDNFLYVNEIDHKRRTAGAEISLILPSNFDFDASYQRETKRGEKLTATVIGSNSMIVPEPLDYTTHQGNAQIRYTDDDFQLQFQYYLSIFDNDHSGLKWQDPRPGRAPVGFSSGGLGQKASMPENWFHQVSASGGLDLPANSRIMLNAAFGWGIQGNFDWWTTRSDNFLPYTINAGLSAPLGLPRPSFDGKLDTRLVTARFVSNPLPKLGINVAYRWNERDNDSPVDTYFRVVSDSRNQSVNDARVNRPYSFEQHKVNADVSYRVYKRTKLTLMYEWDRMTRNLQEVHENNEHSVGGKVVSRPNQYVNLGARFERSFRDRSSYDCVKPLIAGLPSGALTDPGCPTLGGTSKQFENQPLLRKYNMANRRRSDTHAWLTITPLGNLSIGSHVKFIDDDYYKSTLGRTDYRLLSAGVDLSYAATDALNLHAFYNHDRSKSKLNSSSSATSFDPDQGWSSKDRDTTNTVGAGFDFDLLPDRLSVGFDYLYARSVGRVDTIWVIDPSTGAEGPRLPLFPNNKTSLHDISVQGDLQITRNLSLRVGYLFEMFNSYDWATELVCPACLDSSNRVVASGESPPDYNAHLVSLSLIYRFW